MKSANHLFRGFTLIELMLSLGIMTAIFGISSILLSNLIPKANLSSVVETLKAEIRQQQLAAMTNEKDSSDLAADYGVLISSSEYSMFAGTNYNPLPNDSFTTKVPETIELSTDFIDSVVIFEKGSGEILNYNENNKTITITDSISNQSVSIVLNKYGVPE